MVTTEVSRVVYSGSRKCGLNLATGPKCSKRATVELSVTARLSDGEVFRDTGTSVSVKSSLLCSTDADRVTGWYRR